MSTAGGGVTVRVEGAREIRRMLNAVPSKLAAPAMRKAYRAGAKVITRRVQQRARSDPRTHEKNLIARAVKTRAAKRSRRYIYFLTGIGKGFYKGEEFYAAFVELGHFQGKRRGRRSGVKRRGGRRRGSPGGGRRWVEGLHFMERGMNQVKDRAGRKALATLWRLLQAAIRASRKTSSLS